MRHVHGRVCREQEANLQIHLQHLSESDEFQEEWELVEARPIQPGEHNICLCGQTGLQVYFFVENKINGNRTFVGFTCIRRIDPEAESLADYFKHILKDNMYGIYKGQDSHGLHRLEVESNTVLVQGLPLVQHLNPQVNKNSEDEWEVAVKYSKPALLRAGQTYFLRLKMAIKHGQLTFKAL